MTREINWSRWFIGFTLCFIILFILAKGTEAIKNIQKQEAISVKINSEQIEKGIRLQTETKESKSFTSFVTIPLTNKETIDQPIHNWVFEKENLFYDKLEEENLLIDQNHPSHFNIQTEIYKIDEELYSFVLTEEQFINNETINSLTKTYTIDLQKGELLELTDLFDKKLIKENELYDLVKEATDKLDNKKLKKHFKDIQNINWAINGEYITFYIKPEDMDSNNEVISIEIPLVNLYMYMKDSYEDQLISKKMAEEIKQMEMENNIRELEPKGKYIALTFDDGPHAEVTSRVLKYLKKYDARATFYMLSKNAQLYPEIARQVAEEGHEIANHSISHVNLNAVNSDRITTEMLDSQKQIEKVTGITPTTFRPPYGEYNDKVLSIAKNSNTSVIMWSIDTLDWKTRNANS